MKLRYVDQMTHCGMVLNGVADSIEFQFTSLRGIEVLACSFDTDFKLRPIFDNNFCNKRDGKCNDNSIC